jgi:gluconokinase
VTPDRLFRPVPTTTVLEATGAPGLPAGIRVVVGASDGTLATLGAGAVAPGSGALTIGTSGAVRRIVGPPETDPGGRLFCYVLDDRHHVVGGPISSGGYVLRWARDALFPQLALEAGRGVYARFDELAATVAPGADGLVCLPYLLGERAPLWNPDARGALVGLTAGHGQAHVLRALLEGVALQLATVLELVDGLGHAVAVLRADGGFTRSDVWLSIVADVLGRPLELPAVAEGACRGAALLARHALGGGDAFALAKATPVARTIEPDPEHVVTYRDVRARFVALRDQLCER